MIPMSLCSKYLSELCLNFQGFCHWKLTDWGTLLSTTLTLSWKIIVNKPIN